MNAWAMIAFLGGIALIFHGFSIITIHKHYHIKGEKGVEEDE